MKTAKTFIYEYFFCAQVNALTFLICHRVPPWSMVTMINLSSETYSWDQNSIIYYRVYVLNCHILPYTHNNSANSPSKLIFSRNFSLQAIE